MKKILIFIFLLLIPFYVYAEDSCSQDDIQIESIVLDSTQGNIEQTSEPSTDNNSINLGLKANVIDDNATYKVVIKNTSNQDYTFDQSSLSTDYLNYDITYEDNSDIVKAGESKTIYLKVHYATKPSAESLNNGTVTTQPKVTFNLQKEEEVKTIIEEVVNAITNPNTNDKVLIYLGVLVISLIVTIVLLRKYKKAKLTTMLILTFLITTQIVKAVCTCNLDINTNLEIDAKEATFLTGKEVVIKMKELSGSITTPSSNAFSTLDTNILAIKESTNEPSDENKTAEHVVSTDDSPYPIYMWFDNGTIYWWSEDKTPALNEDSAAFLIRLNAATDLSGVEKFDATKAKSFQYAFAGLSIANLSFLKNWNTSSLENLSYAFYENRQLLNLSGLENWDTSNVTTLVAMLYANFNLKDVSAIKNWDVRKVETMATLFTCCFELEEIDLSNWQTDSLTDMKYMFASLQYSGDRTLQNKLKHIYLSSSFNTSKVTDMSSLLYYNEYLEDYDFLQYLDVSNVTKIDSFFQSNTNLTDLSIIRDWDVSKVTTMYLTFAGCLNITSVEPIKNWDVSSVTNMNRTFFGDKNITDIDEIKDWDITNVTSFEFMLRHLTSFPEFTKVQGTWDEKGTFTPNP